MVLTLTAGIGYDVIASLYPFANSLELWTGNSAYPVTTADFNGDGKVDLVSKNYGRNSVLIGLGDGNGGFTRTIEVSAGSRPYDSVISADINGDGEMDLAIMRENGISVRLGNGNGGFSAAHTARMSITSFLSVISADFNGDGKADLASVNWDSVTWDSSVSVLLGDGSGGFTRMTEVSAGSRPSSVISADFNGDGKERI